MIAQVTHGLHHAAYTPSILEWIAVAAAAVVLVWTLWLAVRYTARPGETDADHIKRRILLDEIDEAPEARGR